MSGHQHATLEDTVYFYFGANDTSGSGGDGATPLFDVREAGAASTAIPLLSGTPTLLTHVNFPPGCYEVAIAATAANGFAADDTFAVFCTLAIDSQNPTGFVGSCTLTPLAKAAAIAALNDVAATDIVTGGAIGTTAGAVDDVTLVATTTTNTDVRGTDSALLAASINLTGGAVDTVTTLTNKTGFSLAATGLDAIVSTATGMVEIAKAIWDRVLTGATHNIATSAGRRLRGIQEFQGYEGGAVWIDTINGTAGTVDFENGTVENPVDTIADANTIAASVGLSRFHVLPGSSVTFAATQTNQVFEGNSWALALGGQSIIGTTIIGANVSGVASGVGTMQVYKSCILGATSHVKGTHAINCGISGTQTIVEAGDFFFDQCHSAVANSGTVTIDFGAALNFSTLSVRHHSGGWTVENMGAGTGTYAATFEGDGQIIWAASCSATSNASIRGSWKITDSASGAVTETLDDNQTGVDAILVDTGTDIPATLGTPTDTDLATDIANVQTAADAIPTTAMRGTDNAALASVATEARLAELDAANMPADIAAVKADTVLPEKNQPFADIPVLMVDSTDHVTPKTGLSVTVQRSLDGAAYGNATGSIAEVSNGTYQFDASAADMNADSIMFKFSGTAADDVFLTVFTR